MGLAKKTLLYSTILSVIIVSSMAGYFIWMLPSLYIAYRQEMNYEMAVAIQREYTENRSYDNLRTAAPMSGFTVELPRKNDTVVITNQFFRMELRVTDPEIAGFLARLRRGEVDWENTDFSVLTRFFNEREVINKEFFEIDAVDPFGEGVSLVSSEYRQLSERSFASEHTVTDGQNLYTTHMMMGQEEDAVIMTMVFWLTPRMQEIRPMVLRSLPMIIAAAVFLVLTSSQIFSHLIIRPILRLANHVRSMKNVAPDGFLPIVVKGTDEVSDLSRAFNEQQAQLTENYRLLAEENKRQEVFMRASSHQLKTPVAAALLLAEGMIHEVGKYKDTKHYLPQLKEQLQLMQKMIEDILYLNRRSSHLEWEMVSVPELVSECVRENEILLAAKKITVNWEGEMRPVRSDAACLKIMMGNLLSNAVHYTPEGEKILISFRGDSMAVINYGGKIAAELAPHIFEPFVTGNTVGNVGGNVGGSDGEAVGGNVGGSDGGAVGRNVGGSDGGAVGRNVGGAAWQKGQGLGLYIVASYGRMLGLKVAIRNVPVGVEAELRFEEGLGTVEFPIFWRE